MRRPTRIKVKTSSQEEIALRILNRHQAPAQQALLTAQHQRPLPLRILESQGRMPAGSGPPSVKKK